MPHPLTLFPLFSFRCLLYPSYSLSSTSLLFSPSLATSDEATSLRRSFDATLPYRLSRPLPSVLPHQGIRLTSGKDARGESLGVHVAGLLPESVVARDGRIDVGDRILSVNGEPLDQITNLRYASALSDTTKVEPSWLLSFPYPPRKSISRVKHTVSGTRPQGLPYSLPNPIPMHPSQRD